MIDITKFLAVLNTAVENPCVELPQFLVLRQRSHRDDFQFDSFMTDHESMRVMLHGISENSDDTWVVITLHWYDDAATTGPYGGVVWQWKAGVETTISQTDVVWGKSE
jgi:hypothetical protein